MHSRWIATLVLVLVLLSGCAGKPPVRPAKEDKILIGLSLAKLQEERWQRDRDLFVAKARALGAEVIVQASGGDSYLQMAQAENMLARGVDILVVVPHDDQAMAPIVEMAHEADVKVIAYDRLILKANVDLYLSFNNEKVGELEATYLTKLVPEGRYAFIGGAPNDYNVFMLRSGAMKILQPMIDEGRIELVFSDFAEDWRPENAEKLAHKALDQGRVDAFVVANDGTAGGVIRALYRRGLAGKVPVSGQDADLAAVQRIVAGTQSMTVYKPIRLLAERAAVVAVSMAKGGEPEVNARVYNGTRQVPSYLLEPILVDKQNWRETVVKDEFHREQEILGGAGQEP